MKVTKLCTYMKARAKHEGVEWAMPNAFMQQQFDVGIRSFFGVIVDEKGRLLSDNQQPEFFQSYHAN